MSDVSPDTDLLEDEPDPRFAVIDSVHHYRGWVVDVHTDEVRMPDGSTAKRDIIGHSGAVAVVALDDEGNVVLVRQFRAPLGMQLWELPAGLLDIPDEPALVAAQRELLEETALEAARWDVLLDLHTSPGMTNEAIRVYLARGLADAERAADFTAHGEEVSMTVTRVPLAHAVERVLAGSITNGPAVAGLLAADRLRARNWTGLRAVDAPWRARPELV